MILLEEEYRNRKKEYKTKYIVDNIKHAKNTYEMKKDNINETFEKIIVDYLAPESPTDPESQNIQPFEGIYI